MTEPNIFYQFIAKQGVATVTDLAKVPKHRHIFTIADVMEALREAWHEKRMTSDDIWHYAKVCRVANVMRPYLESLV